MSALRGLLIKEFQHVARDRRTLTVILLLPIVQVLLFGFAIRTDVNQVKLAIVDRNPDAATMELRNRFAAAGLFEIRAVERSPERLGTLFERDAAQLAIVFEDGFGQRLARGLPARVQIIVGEAEPNTGTQVQNYALAIIEGYERELAGRSGALRIVPELRLRFNPTNESSNLFVPGLMAMVLTIISALMTAISLTREKETGTMEALLVSPLRPWQIIVGKVAPYLLFGFIAMVAVIVEARLVFDVPIRGSLMLLLGEGLLFILVSLSLGILISARTSSQRVAMMGALMGTMLPTMLLSGFLFPIESMPAPLQVISHAVPARWFVHIARGIMLKGVGLSYLWPQTLVLLAMSAVLLTLSTRSFKIRLQ